MQSSCATSHKLHITVVRFKTKLELSKNFNFPKKQISWLFNYHFNTVQFEVFTVVDKNYSLDATMNGNLLFTFWKSLLPPLSGWCTKCMLFGRIGHILQGLIRLGETYNHIFTMLIYDLMTESYLKCMLDRLARGPPTPRDACGILRPPCLDPTGSS